MNDLAHLVFGASRRRVQDRISDEIRTALRFIPLILGALYASHTEVILNEKANASTRCPLEGQVDRLLLA